MKNIVYIFGQSDIILVFNFYIISIMNNKIISLIERNADNELKAYFESLTSEHPLDLHEELVLLEHFSPAAVKSYINRFRFSKDAEKVFVQIAPADIRLTYLNYYGLTEETQRCLIHCDKVEALRDFAKMRRLADPEYLINIGSNEAVRVYLAFNPLENDDQVYALLHRDNPSLFAAYANKWVISENVKRKIVEERNYAAFKTIVYRFYRLFRKKAAKAKDFCKLMETLAAEALPAELQVEVLTSYDRDLIQLLLMTCPLAAEAQEVLWKRNFDAEWLKLHVEHLYCMGGYRFAPENEQKLFKVLASKSLDDCLTQFRHRDDVSFVKFATPAAVKKYVAGYWLSDDAQVALINRGNGELIKELISRYSPEHGMCWQAEVELVKLGATEAVRQYIAFHSMCWEALSLLKENFPAVAEEYYAKHPY